MGFNYTGRFKLIGQFFFFIRIVLGQISELVLAAKKKSIWLNFFLKKGIIHLQLKVDHLFSITSFLKTLGAILVKKYALANVVFFCRAGTDEWDFASFHWGKMTGGTNERAPNLKWEMDATQLFCADFESEFFASTSGFP